MREKGREGRRKARACAHFLVVVVEALFAGFFFPRFLEYNIAIYSQSERVGKRFSIFRKRAEREVCVRVCVEGSMVRAVASLYTHPFGGWEQAQKWMCFYVLFVGEVASR